jgi:predicted metalloprotease
MKWRRGKRSGDIIDRRGTPGSAMGAGLPLGAGLGGTGLLIVIAIVVVMNLVGGGSLGDVLGGLNGGGIQQAQPGEDPIPRSEDEDAKLVDFISFVLDDVQTEWTKIFQSSDKTYEKAELVLFEQSTNSACGGATEDIGPHYCPGDQRVYIDLDFFRELRQRFGAPGDFAQAYVLAHEIGHHVQNLLGIEQEVRKAQRDDPDQTNDLSIRMELQADCFAGVWGYTTFQRDILESGDLQEGLDAAAAVGDDRIQKQATGRVNPESWTHGSSEMRMRWFRVGFDSGDPAKCDTFSADSL